MSHPQHPHCECKKALFKSPATRKVKPSEPYAYCRNVACKQYAFRRLLGAPGFDPKAKQFTDEQLAVALQVSKVAPDALERAAPKPTMAKRPKVPPVVAHPETGIPVPADTRPAETKPVSKRGRARAAMPASAAPPRPVEPAPIAAARRRLKDLLGRVIPGGSDKASAGLVLAILSQETGNQRAAEALIDEYQLDVKFGLQKFPANTSTG
jgi:hypothetical protein